MLKKILAVVGGIVTANVIIIFNEIINHRLYPLPPGVSYETNKEAFFKYIETVPVEAKLMIIFGYAVAAFAGGFVATKIKNDGNRYYALIVGGFLLAATILNFMMMPIPTPIWIWVLGIAAPFLAIVGFKLASHKE